MSDACQRGPTQWPITIALGAALSVCFLSAYVLANGQTSVAAELLTMGAKVDDWVNDGERWRLVLSSWLHADTHHLLVNVLWLIVLGRILRDRIGEDGVFATWALGAFGGQCLSYIANTGASVGASGGVAALFAQTLSLYYGLWGHLTWRVRLGLILGTIAATTMLFVAPNATHQVDHSAHLGGVLIGLFMSWIGRSSTSMWLAISLTLLGALGASLGSAETQEGEAVWISETSEFRLPKLGMPGVYQHGRCEGAWSDAPGEQASLSCVSQDWRMMAVTGSVTQLIQEDPVLASYMPSPGRCIQFQYEGETLLMAHSPGGQALVFATITPLWGRYTSLRKAVINDQCRGRRARLR